MVSDDGSSDSSLKIVRDFECEFNGKLDLFINRSSLHGAKNNFAYLLSLTNAPYIMFCDQDDVWLKYKIEVTLRKMQELEALHPDKPVLVHSDLEVVDESLNPIASSMFDYQRLPRHTVELRELMVQNNITGCTVMINRRALEVSLPIPAEAIMHDWWVGCKVLQSGGVIGLVPEALVKYRQHENNSVGSKRIGFKYYFSKLIGTRGYIHSFWAIYRQAKALDPSVSATALVFCKIRLTLNRLLGKQDGLAETR